MRQRHRLDRSACAPASLRSRSDSALTLIHLICIPVTNTSEPTSRHGPSADRGGLALQQLWLVLAAPLTGDALGGVASAALAEELPCKPAIVGDARSSST